MIQKLSSRELAIDYLLNKIKSGELKTGDKVMNERDLSELLGISRVPLREAICTLSTIGILEARQGDGTFVGGYNPKIISNIIKNYGLLDGALVEEVFESRMLFEADAVRLAAGNRNVQDLLKLELSLQKHEQTLHRYISNEADIYAVMACDSEVHEAFAQASHNNFIVQIVATIRHASEQDSQLMRELSNAADHFIMSVKTHRAIFDAIKRQDGEAAYRFMQQHISQIRSAMHRRKLHTPVN